MPKKYNREGGAATVIQALPITSKNYEKYGDIVAADEKAAFVSANMGTAKRFNFLSDLENLRGDKARLNMCVFRCTPYTKFPIEIKLLEKHQYSTQIFIPMSGAIRYLVVVSMGGDTPDLPTLGAFVVQGAQGISYKPGIWHHPIIALDQETDLACLVWEDSTSDDCKVVNLSASCLVNF